MTKDEIKQKWENNKVIASTAGTKMHRDIELFYSNIKLIILVLNIVILIIF